MLSDLVRTALAALDRGELPAPTAARELVAACRRAERGLAWRAAVGDAGTLATRQRNAALVQLADWCDTGPPAAPWHLAGRVRELLERPPPRPPAAIAEAMDTATRTGAAELSQCRIWQILTVELPNRAA